MRAGYGISDITPPLGVELAGYGYYLQRRAQAVRDPLHARALLLEDGNVRALVVSAEVLGLSRAVCGPVLEHAREALACPPENVILVSVHTHTGPAVKYHEGCGEVDEGYAGSLAARICAALDDALQDLDEVTSLSGAMNPLAGKPFYNRADPQNGPVDGMARGFVLRRGAKPPVAVVSAACHCVSLGRVSAISADYAGEVCRLVREEGCLPLFVNGLCGDIDPVGRGEETLKACAQAVKSAFFSRGFELPLTLRAGTLPFTLRRQPVTIEEIESSARGAVERAGGEATPAARVALAWRRDMLGRLSALKPEEPARAAWVALGAVPMVALPF